MVLCQVIILVLLVGTAYPGETVIIVHPSNHMDPLSLDDLKNLYKGDIKFWQGGERVVLILPPRGSVAMKSLALKVFNTSNPSNLFKYYLKAIFQQKFTSPPRSVKGTREAIDLVSSSPGAIAVVVFDEVSESKRVKIVRVAGF